MPDYKFTQNEKNGIVYMTSGNLASVHAFTTRYGGVSSGIYASLNLGQSQGRDDTENIRENYARLFSALGIDPGHGAFTHQVHENTVRKVSLSDCTEPMSAIPYDADGLITDEPGIALFAFTADCLPLLLEDTKRGVVSAVHCGWRGTVADIAGCAVRSMINDYGCDPSDIRAAVGPGISVCCFETGGDVRDAVIKVLGYDDEAVCRPCGGGKYMTDLKEINRRLLIRAGVLSENIAVSDECTMCSPEKYWSHRYTKGQRGAQAAVIMLKGAEN